MYLIIHTVNARIIAGIPSQGSETKVSSLMDSFSCGTLSLPQCAKSTSPILTKLFQKSLGTKRSHRLLIAQVCWNRCNKKTCLYIYNIYIDAYVSFCWKTCKCVFTFLLEVSNNYVHVMYMYIHVNCLLRKQAD